MSRSFCPVLIGLIGIFSAAQVPAATVPRVAHVVVVIMENHSAPEIYGSASAPYLNTLVTGGAKFSSAFGVTHPNQPNYVAMFSGSTQGVVDDSCRKHLPPATWRSS